MLNPEAEVLSGDTVKEHILLMFREERNCVRKVLQDAPGKISFTLDAWTLRNQLPFLGITAHWVDSEWNLRSILLDFQLLSGPHSGENLQEVFELSCRELGILTKVRLKVIKVCEVGDGFSMQRLIFSVQLINSF
jgi:hypothetical protein